MFPNGGLILLGNMHGALAWKIGHLIPDFRRQEFVHHSYMEIVSQRIGQILCGYEDANDCNQLRGDSAYTYTKQKKRTIADSLLEVIRLGFEPKTPTLKVLCSTN